VKGNYKTISFILLFTLTLFFVNNSFGQKDFTKLKMSTDSSYGYTQNNPLPMKDGKYSNRIKNVFKFLSGLKTEDNQTLNFLWRNAYAPNTLDEFVLVTSKTNDTINIFTDINKKGKLKLPIGLKYEQPKG
jgi:hypothetical protein